MRLGRCSRGQSLGGGIGYMPNLRAFVFEEQVRYLWMWPPRVPAHDADHADDRAHDRARTLGCRAR